MYIMSRELGSFIPESLLQILGSTSTRKPLVIELLLVDMNGYPHVCLLSPYQIVALNTKDVYFCVYKGTKTEKSLVFHSRYAKRPRVKCAFVVFENGGAYYIKGEAKPLHRVVDVKKFPSSSVFYFKTKKVLFDFSDKSPIVRIPVFDEKLVKKVYKKVYESLLFIANNLKKR